MAATWDPVDMQKVAFHEAGHAVVAWLFGLPLKRIYLDLETEGGGAVSEVDLAHLCIVQALPRKSIGRLWTRQCDCCRK